MRKLKVDLKDRSYSIVIGCGAIDIIDKQIKGIKPSKIIIITDDIVDSLYGSLVAEKLKKYQFAKIVIPHGEKNKNLYTISAVYNELVRAKADRQTLIIALGGGVVGDMAGFIAATYMRGLPYIQIPTTLLAQVDSSIGGKTGVDHIGKNLVGAFYQPKLVLIDPNFLQTLSPKEIKNGLAEVIKYGIIKDASIVKMLKNNPKASGAFFETLIAKCAAIKAGIVSKDERETSGLRMVLNLGHTFGHAIEAVSGYSKYSHGEAVALGMLAASYLSNKMGILSQKSLEGIIHIFDMYKMPNKAKIKTSKIIKLLSLDKKAFGKKIRFVLPKSIGSVVIKEGIDKNLVKWAIEKING